MTQPVNYEYPWTEMSVSATNLPVRFEVASTAHGSYTVNFPPMSGNRHERRKQLALLRKAGRRG